MEEYYEFAIQYMFGINMLYFLAGITLGGYVCFRIGRIYEGSLIVKAGGVRIEIEEPETKIAALK